MSLRVKLILYLGVIHLLFAGLAIYLLLQHRVWLLVVEAFFAASLIAGLRLSYSIFGTLELIRTGAQFISDRDFTSRFREVGQPEMDQLIQIYNRMVDNLREERTKLQEQNYFLEKVLTASPSGIITLDFDERIAMVNPSAQRLLQLSLDSLIGKRLLEIDQPLAIELNQLHTGEAKVLSILGRRRVKCQKSQFLDRGFLRNFILMEELTEELRQSEKAAYDKLIRMMSHEVNNSLGAANSLLHSCLNYQDQLHEDDRKDFETAINVVISRTDQLNRFMKSFADVVRLPQPRRHPFDLKQMLEELTLLMSAEATRRNISWQWDIQAELEPIHMDRGQMEQVFVNVFKNAMEAIGENGRITIRIFKQNRRGAVTIEDTGNGITSEVRANLFTPFYSTKENGQGIGLTIVQEILAQHHFDFSLDGSPGQPTQFTINF